ncbi:hypothetical protein LYNGBM3L_60250 [Moorena producens 3L]|uniref:Uncharacterized protein n=2 Tax=Coleofasciculaceae TaxID=1892251 RepID=F4Y065_9CYAN|nr:hypothetical protein LYNGBM3L_60250 [Moorena producens 3L]
MVTLVPAIFSATVTVPLMAQSSWAQTQNSQEEATPSDLLQAKADQLFEQGIEQYQSI